MIRGTINEFILTWRLIRDPRVAFWAKIIPVAALLYVLSPLDFIPDFIIGIGQLDDLGIIFAGLRLFQAVIPAYITDEHRKAIAAERPSDNAPEKPKYRVMESDEMTR